MKKERKAVPCPEEVVAGAVNLTIEEKAKILIAMAYCRLHNIKFAVVEDF